MLNQNYDLCKYLRYMYCDKFNPALQNSALTFSHPVPGSAYLSLTVLFKDNA